ncbi:hypothetical protein FISHEDRAFT_72829 [Fistulina hepatica ATCC 64428]|nr:hypothetical protein FISHEDRAFT_72829 [Fistulina hepatica ATCC 64428]
MDPDLFIDTFLGHKKYPKKKFYPLLTQISKTEGTENNSSPPLVKMFKALMPKFLTRSVSRNLAKGYNPGPYFMDLATATQMPLPWTEKSPILLSQTDLITKFEASTNADPFSDPRVDEHDPYNTDEESTWGQILDYVTRVYSTRPRSCLFCIWMDHSHARLMRFNPSGMAVTRSFLYVPATVCDSSPLARFLHNFRHATPQQRADLEDIKRIHAKLGDYNPLFGHHTSKDKAADVEPIPAGDVDDSNEPPMYRITVYSREGEYPQDYLAWSPFKLPHSPRGRMTSAFPAISRFPPDDGSDDDPVFLKNCFRDMNSKSLTEEIDILLALEQKDVERVPRYLYGGYVPSDGDATHTSRMQEIFKGMKTYKQYRFVYTPLCRPLSTAVNVKQFAEVLADALEAHRQAWESVDPQLRVLHRDISDTNIQIGPDGRGYHNDWDSSIIYATSLECKEPRRFALIGTWYFMASTLLMNPGRVPHRAEEDLESFFWVVVYFLLKYFPVKETSPAILRDLEENFFYEVKIDAKSGQMTGGTQKNVEVWNRMGWLRQLDVEGFPAFSTWVHKVALRIRQLWLNERLRKEAHGQPGLGKLAPEDIPELSTHEAMSQLFMELVQSLEADKTQGARSFPPEKDRFLAAYAEKKLKSMAADKEQAKRTEMENLQRNSGSLQQRDAQKDCMPPPESSRSTSKSQSLPHDHPHDHDSEVLVPHAPPRRSARLATKLANAVQVPPASAPTACFASSSRKRHCGDEPHEEAPAAKRSRCNEQAPRAGPSRRRGNGRAAW